VLDDRDILCVRAPNPGPLTLSGTNTWLVGRRPTWVIDPGPAIAAHLERVLAQIAARGGLAGVALTHSHSDHSGAVAELLERCPAPLAACVPEGAGGGETDVALAEDVRFGPLTAVATPGHASDHFAFVGYGACFSGDAVLGEGSVFIAPARGAMSGYLSALARLRARADFTAICPGHGPVVWNADEKLAEYIAHRNDRERRLRAALADGRRSVQELLDAAWPEVQPALRPAAAVTLAAHLDKLEEEGTLPPGVERPQLPRSAERPRV
jgi:glyoxylase-like metal-dependent hydrolase (beta-lactamase superfamily II)